MLEALDEPLHIPKLDLALWVLLTGVCGAAIFGSVKASKAFVRTYDANAKKIVDAEKSLAKAAKAERGGVRANAALIKDLDSRRTGLNKESLQLWQTLYDRQAKFTIWPKEAGIAQVAEVAKDAPAEEPAGKKGKGKKTKVKSKDKAKAGTAEEIPEATCKSYNEHVVRSEFERIFASLQVRRPKANGPSSSLTQLPFNDRPADFEGLVAWDPTQRDAIISRRYLTKGVPSSVRVRLVQEDLWVFGSLVDAIQTLNRNAKDALSAPLKQVDVLEVAQWATAACVQQPPTIWMPEGSESAKPPSPSAPSVPAPDAADGALLDSRYLDEKGQPLKAGAPQPFAEFKQIFVFLKVVVDQRRVPDLLTALANAALPVEVRHFAVQVLPDVSVGEVTLSPDDTVTARSSTAAATTISSLTSAETTAWDATVEIGGVIYLYNPPEIKKLGTGAAKLPTERMFRIPAVAAGTLAAAAGAPAK